MTRRIIAALLSAAALMPGVAAAQDGRHNQDRDGRAQAQAGRNERPDRAERQRPDRGDAQRRAEPRTEQRAEQRAARPDYRNRGDEQRQRIAVRQDRGNGGRYDGRGQVADRGRYDRGDYGRNQAYRGRPNYAATDYRRSWNNSWRNDRRYDWNSYRNYNRGAFHLPRYYAPYGWNYGYRRFSIGVRLSAPLFGENYWIDDPYDYRLPEAYGSYRWVRYYGDAILVDVRSGYVVDVIHDIFW